MDGWMMYMYGVVLVESRCVDIVVFILLTTAIFPISVNLCTNVPSGIVFVLILKINFS